MSEVLLKLPSRIKSALPSDMFRILIVCIGLGLVLLLFQGMSLFFRTWQVESDPPVVIHFMRGMSTAAIANRLEAQGVIPSARAFRFSARMLGNSAKLQAGKYAFTGRQSNYAILRTLGEGRVVLEQITFTEGMRCREMAGLAQRRLQVDSAAFMHWAHDPEFCKSLKIPSASLEGYLFPETYRFHTDVTEKEILARMTAQYHKVFTDSMRHIAGSLGFTEHEIITLASLIEGEALVDTERPIISAIYLNRLKRGYLLESCPTVQYIIDGPPRRLLLKDLDIASPYNTYIHRGLPPGPVNNPGRASIMAALNPAQVDYLFLVANGDGTHTFSRTLDDHIRAKHRFDRIRRLYR